MEYQDITVAVYDYIATVTLNRPKKLNAFTHQMAEEITQAYESLGQRNDVRVIVMTGAGRGFCAGADIGGMFQRDIDKREKADSRSTVIHPRSGLHYALHNCSKPTIAAINGPAMGVGLTLALIQDMRVMAENASAGAIFTRMGLMPELGSTFILPRLIGLAKALELVTSAKVLTGQEAHAIGLVNQVVPDDQLLNTVRDLARQISALPPVAVAMSKRALHQGAASDFDTAVQTETFGLDYLYKTHDHKEAVAAFLEKREPRFQDK